MQSTNIVRSIGLVAKRPLALPASQKTSRSRHYATPAPFKEEVDPQLNGYPQLPFTSRQNLPAKGWWDQQMRRNFGDPVSLEYSSEINLPHATGLVIDT